MEQLKRHGGSGESPGWLGVDGLLAQFNDTRGVARRQYRGFVNDGIGRESVWEAPSLKDIEGGNRDRKKAMRAAYVTGAYSYQQIGKPQFLRALLN